MVAIYFPDIVEDFESSRGNTEQAVTSILAHPNHGDVSGIAIDIDVDNETKFEAFSIFIANPQIKELGVTKGASVRSLPALLSRILPSLDKVVSFSLVGLNADTMDAAEVTMLYAFLLTHLPNLEQLCLQNDCLTDELVQAVAPFLTESTITHVEFFQNANDEGTLKLPLKVFSSL